MKDMHGSRTTELYVINKLTRFKLFCKNSLDCECAANA